MVTRVFKVYGLPRYKYFEPDRKCKEIYSDASALRINESFRNSYTDNISGYNQDGSFDLRLINVLCADVNNSHAYVTVMISRNTTLECFEEIQGQCTDGIFEGQNIGKVTVMSGGLECLFAQDVNKGTLYSEHKFDDLSKERLIDINSDTCLSLDELCEYSNNHCILHDLEPIFDYDQLENEWVFRKAGVPFYHDDDYLDVMLEINAIKGKENGYLGFRDDSYKRGDVYKWRNCNHVDISDLD